MSPLEMALHARKKFRQFTDARRERDWGRNDWPASGSFPVLPDPAGAPPQLRKALDRDVKDILAGHWKAFGHVELKVDDPPKWHCDYLAGCDLPTTESAFRLNHRRLPVGSDIKLIWELSRWYQLVRLAMAAHVLDDIRAAETCVRWLEDWVKHNPPYRGWNWTSALEVGIRLIQFAWIDALLTAWAKRSGTNRLVALRGQILPSHAWYAWRHRSFGSSANNHLLGELTGLIVATARWPALAQWGAPVGQLQRRWEREVLAQFAEDGGNKEQALNYQLFSWEFCWQAMAALHDASRDFSIPLLERWHNAGSFFVKVQVDEEPWDYGDSDSAVVVPFVNDISTAPLEWREWAVSPKTNPTLDYWLGDTRHALRSQYRKAVGDVDGFTGAAPATVMEFPKTSPRHGWVGYPRSGLWVCRTNRWTLRWDLSPLGYLATAAHGHLDAQHLSLWLDEIAFVIDPGTGAYFADTHLRNWLASRGAHNSPCPLETAEWPRRHGPFLWETHHAQPQWGESGSSGIWSSMRYPTATIRRTIEFAAEARVVGVEDAVADGDLSAFSVRWQFAPGSRLEALDERRFRVTRRGVSIEAKVSADWAEVCGVTEQGQRAAADPGNDLAGVVSPSFRRTVWAPYLKLVARPAGRPCVFQTSFQVLPSTHED